MATKNTLTVVAQAKDEATASLLKAAKAYVDANKAAEESDKKVALAARIKNAVFHDTEIAGKVAAGAMKGVAIAGTAVAAAVTAAGASLFALAKRAADAGDAAGDMASSAGVSVEFLTRMGFAAKQSGSSLEAVKKAVQTISKNAVDGSKSFAAWGIELRKTNGDLKTGEELFVEAGEKIRGLEDPVLQVAAAQALFGKTGKELVPIFTDAEMSLQDFADQSDRLGITITAAEVAISDRFMDALGRLEGGLDGAARKAGLVFAPTFTAAMGEAEKSLPSLIKVVEDNKDALQKMTRDGLVFAAQGVAMMIRGVGFLIQGFDNARDNMLEMRLQYLQFQRAITFDDAEEEKLSRQIGAVAIEISDLTNSAADRQRVLDALANSAEEVGARIAAMSKADEAAAGSATKAAEARAKHTVALKRESDAKAKASKEDETAAEREAAARERRINRAFAEEERSAAEAERAKEDRELGGLVKEQEAEQRAVKKAAEEKKKSEDRARDAAQSLSSSLASPFVQMIKGAQSAEDFVAAMLERLATRVLESGLESLFTMIFSGGLGGGGGILSSVFGLLGFKHGGIIPRPQRFAGGGIVDGPPGVDRVPGAIVGPNGLAPALFSRGEGVLDPNLTQDLRRALSVSGSSASSAAAARPGDVHLHLAPQISAVALPHKVDNARYFRDNLVPLLKEALASGQLDFLRKG